ncbi:MAG: NUDIX hydrolase [Dehalococcoidia bacterium]|nr:NUDIX hydrolase [Dehalococcoidia bacterium]
MNDMYDYCYGMRDRATAVVLNRGHLLLVRDRGFREFSLPGGGLHEGETAEEAVARELWEETGLTTVSLAPLPNCRTSDVYNTYLVFDVVTKGTLRIDPVELSDARWWNGQEPLPLFGYVSRVLSHLHWPK